MARVDTYQFPIPPVDESGAECANFLEATFWALGQAQQAHREMQTALEAARGYVSVHEQQARGALQLGYERRAAMMAFAGFCRGFHTVACAFEVVAVEDSYVIVVELQELDNASEVFSREASRLGEELSEQPSAALEACR